MQLNNHLNNTSSTTHGLPPSSPVRNGKFITNGKFSVSLVMIEGLKNKVMQDYTETQVNQRPDLNTEISRRVQKYVECTFMNAITERVWFEKVATDLSDWRQNPGKCSYLQYPNFSSLPTVIEINKMEGSTLPTAIANLLPALPKGAPSKAVAAQQVGVTARRQSSATTSTSQSPSTNNIPLNPPFPRPPIVSKQQAPATALPFSARIASFPPSTLLPIPTPKDANSLDKLQKKVDKLKKKISQLEEDKRIQRELIALQAETIQKLEMEKRHSFLPSISTTSSLADIPNNSLSSTTSQTSTSSREQDKDTIEYLYTDIEGKNLQSFGNVIKEGGEKPHSRKRKPNTSSTSNSQKVRITKQRASDT